MTCAAAKLLSVLNELYGKVTTKNSNFSVTVKKNGLLEKSSISRGGDMTYVCFFVGFSSVLVSKICIYSNWSLDLVKNVNLPEKLSLLYHEKILLQKSSIF